MDENQTELMEEGREGKNGDKQFMKRMEFHEDDDEVPCMRCSDCDMSSSSPCGWRYSFSLMLKYSLLVPFTYFNIVVPILMINIYLSRIIL